MKMEYTAEILRGWPLEGARERVELVKQGSVLVNGDVVEAQPDGTVAKVSATKSKRVGLVVRGNGDSQSGAISLGTFMSPQPAKTVTAMAWAGGVVTATVAGHGYVVGNVVTIAGVTPAGYNGSYIITAITANTFSYALASNPGTVTVQGTSQLTSTSAAGGKATVLWGNYIARVSNYDTGSSYAPGSPLTAANGVFTLANGTTDPEVGFVLRVQGANASETAHLTAVFF